MKHVCLCQAACGPSSGTGGEVAVCSLDCLLLRVQPEAPYAHEGFQNRMKMMQKKRHAAKEKINNNIEKQKLKSSRGKIPSCQREIKTVNAVKSNDVPELLCPHMMRIPLSVILP